MLLLDLLRTYDAKITLTKAQNVAVTGVQEDSRRVRAGNLFVARSGNKTDGAKYIADAVANGAVAILSEQKLPGCSIPQIVVKNAGSALSVLANAFYGNPSETVKVFAVTGTNGKTTTAYLIRHLLRRAGRKCGLIGTVEVDDGKRAYEADMTTPSAVDVAALLATMRDNGCWSCAMEASSHALDQGRTGALHFAGAAFTNLTGDHLDYHKTMENYAAAKAKLFEQLDSSAVAAYNADDQWADQIVKNCKGRLIGYGLKTKTDYGAKDISITSQGTRFVLTAPDGQAEVRMSLIGKHNIENALAAVALVGETFHLSVHQLAAGLEDAQGAPGRLQAVRAGQPFAVLVDYAHTDDALENVLTACRPLTRGKLRVIFGCGGDRDRTKRPRMARVAQKLADAIYVTSDNPRTEDPNSIINEIVKGFGPETRKSIVVEADRRRAIERAMAEAGHGDVVLIAGKGHENYQIIGTTKHHFDDVEEATRVLKARVVAA
jgi:UDP-N-acetylmuramoyl-L-alanyl-D-glutamate--2,6-diaminopimelate ligase